MNSRKIRSAASLILLLATCFLCAQAPSGFKFQAVASDAGGEMMANANVAVRVSILENSGAGAVAYAERHLVTTSDLGVFDLQVGNGNTLSGDMSSVDWGARAHYLKIEMDPAGGTNYVNLGATQLVSVPYALYAETSGDGGGGDPTDELQNLIYDPATQMLTLTDGNSVTLQGEPLELPYFEEASSPNNMANFHVHNQNSSGYGLVGSSGRGMQTVQSNRAGVLGQANAGHGVYGYAETSFYAGVQGVSNSSGGYGVIGYSFGGGTGGHFYTSGGGRAALTTGQGKVGIGTQAPEEKMHVAGSLLVQSDVGALLLGFPGNGNRWRLSTTNGGADLLFRARTSTSPDFNTRFGFRQGGEFQVGEILSTSAWAHVRNNSTISKPHLKLEEVGNDCARLELTNDNARGAYWHVAGLPSTTTANARLNFYFRNGNGAADRMTVTGDGKVGINGTPTARLHVYQRSQSVGTGLRFSDGTANQDWDVTHGFALRFHYGGDLRGFINANTGAYTQSSDASLKTGVASLGSVLPKLVELRPTTYAYKDTDGKKTIGFIAQEARELFPELVTYSATDELYGVDYAGFSVVAIRAIQEQQETIDALRAELKAQGALLKKLERLVTERD